MEDGEREGERKRVGLRHPHRHIVKHHLRCVRRERERESAFFREHSEGVDHFHLRVQLLRTDCVFACLRVCLCVCVAVFVCDFVEMREIDIIVNQNRDREIVCIHREREKEENHIKCVCT